MSGNKVYKKKYLDINVYEAAINRINKIYDLFDTVIVSFSGGKDSTAVLNLTLEVARKRNRLPLRCVFFDEEAIHDETIDYVRRVYNDSDIDMDWLCLEVDHRNASSGFDAFWTCWDKNKKDLWCRELPPEGKTKHKYFVKGTSFQDFCPLLYNDLNGSVAMLTGIRTEESLRRYQVIASKKSDFFYNPVSENSTNQYRCFPIYDWTSNDVWIAVRKFGWDYNKTYDLFNKTHLYNKFLHQRVCPPFGEEPIQSLNLYKECFPSLWDKMQRRVAGANSGAIYGKSLYSGNLSLGKNKNYKDLLNVILDSYSGKPKKDLINIISGAIKSHTKKTKEEIPDEAAHNVTGLSYKFLCLIARKGDFKGRKMVILTNKAKKAQDKAVKK